MNTKTDSPSTGDVGIGVDVGTQGARVVAVSEAGRVLASAAERWPLQGDDSGRREQDPDLWWKAIVRSLRSVLTTVEPRRVTCLSVVATSGTMVLLDDQRAPLRPAIMWNDKRAGREAQEATTAFHLSNTDLGLAIQPTFTLAKALWVRRNEPEVWARTRFVASAGDWLLSRLTGTDPVTDYTNALKTGADLVALSWPPTIESLGVPLSMLPPIVAPGTILGGVCRAASAETGLPASVNVVAGVTDANAAQIASGAVGVGNWVTTIGTGLSVKGVTVNRLVDDSGALYSHRHWNGGWIPSATSHCGAESIGRRFEGQDLEQLTRESASFPTSSVLVLPLATVGEFFPFFAPSARGFEFGAAGSRGDLFLGYLEGIAFIERMAMARFRQAGATVGGPQVTMGGGASNLRWLSLRASVLNRPVARPRQANPAFGAAIIALAGPGGEINETVRRMVSYDVVVDPVAEACARYAELFDAFLTELRRRGYVASDQTGEEF